MWWVYARALYGEEAWAKFQMEIVDEAPYLKMELKEELKVTVFKKFDGYHESKLPI